LMVLADILYQPSHVHFNYKCVDWNKSYFRRWRTHAWFYIFVNAVHWRIGASWLFDYCAL